MRAARSDRKKKTCIREVPQCVQLSSVALRRCQPGFLSANQKKQTSLFILNYIHNVTEWPLVSQHVFRLSVHSVCIVLCVDNEKWVELALS